MQTNKKRLLLFIAVLLLTAGTAVLPALAYFTSYAITNASYPVHIRDSAIIEEDYSDWVKRIRITADQDADPVYIRARAFHSDLYGVSYSDPDNKWEQREDGFWYYKDILYAEQTTSELVVKIENIPVDLDGPMDFGVAVIYESTPVRYKSDGTPYADWGKKLIHMEDNRNGGDA